MINIGRVVFVILNVLGVCGLIGKVFFYLSKR